MLFLVYLVLLGFCFVVVVKVVICCFVGCGLFSGSHVFGWSFAVVSFVSSWVGWCIGGCVRVCVGFLSRSDASQMPNLCSVCG